MHKFFTVPAAVEHWNKHNQRCGLARLQSDGTVLIFDRPSEAIGHPSTVVATR